MALRVEGVSLCKPLRGHERGIDEPATNVLQISIDAIHGRVFFVS
jgi:hypothetical protein